MHYSWQTIDGRPIDISMAKTSTIDSKQKFTLLAHLFAAKLWVVNKIHRILMQ